MPAQRLLRPVDFHGDRVRPNGRTRLAAQLEEWI